LSVVLSIRIPEELKKEIDEVKDFVDIKEEIVCFLWERVRAYKRLKVLKEVRSVLNSHPELPSGIAVKLVREDRDSR